MQHLENDMDDLFKRAAEDYPLQSGDGDWENIAKQLVDKSEPAAIVSGKGKKGWRIILTLLLLLSLPISWIIIERSVTKRPYALPAKKTGKEKDLRDSEPVTGNAHPILTAEENTLSVPGENNKKANYTKRVIHSSGQIHGQVAVAISGDIPDDSRPVTSGQIEKDYKPATELSYEDDNSSARNIDAKKEEGNPENQPNQNKKISKPDIVQVGNFENNIRKNDSPVVAKNSKKEKKAGFHKNSRIYAGLVVGPDLSKVQSMSFSTAGIDAGLVAGYGLSAKLWLETGISWTKKYYNTAGKDFNMDKVRSSMTGMVIDNLASQSTLIEIPVKLKYDLISKKVSSFFIAGGLSAYIMTKEKNKYNVTMNGSREKVTGIYQKNNYRLPAVVNISLGYEHDLNGSLQLRIEPFLKIPIKGVGVGSLPITSTGLQIGIIGRLK